MANSPSHPCAKLQVVLDAVTVSQQLAVATLKTVEFVYLQRGELKSQSLLAFDLGLLACGFLFHSVLHGHKGSGSALRQSTRIGLLLLGGLLALTPLFQTMTAAISDDTAVATAAYSLILHLLLHDYTFLNDYSSRLSSSVSLGAATFAAVLLASRLTHPFMVFADMLLAMQLFVLSPFLRRDIRRVSQSAHLVLTGTMHVAAFFLVLRLSGTLACTYAFAVLGIVLLCPLWLVRMMKFKQQINGPWDEARLDPALTRSLTRKANVSKSGGVGF